MARSDSRGLLPAVHTTTRTTTCTTTHTATHTATTANTATAIATHAQYCAPAMQYPTQSAQNEPHLEGFQAYG